LIKRKSLWKKKKNKNQIQSSFCDCIRKAGPLTDQEILTKKDKYMEKYRYDYIHRDPGGTPLKNYFGGDWGESYLKDFLFAP